MSVSNGRRRVRTVRRTAVALALCAILAACGGTDHEAVSHAGPVLQPSRALSEPAGSNAPKASSRPVQPRPGRAYPWHTGIVSTTFWVGEVFDPTAADGSQVYSTFDAAWQRHYGGCDGKVIRGTCRTERRTARNGFFPQHMKPHQNPFYLDLPYDDVNDPTGFRQRCRVIPWASDPGYRGHCSDPAFSYLKDRWVKIIGPNRRTCYGQIEDAGPGKYHDSRYVFGAGNKRPANRRYGGAGADVSPALNGCLGFRELDGDTDRISWRFVDAVGVPNGPWRRIVTKTPVVE